MKSEKKFDLVLKYRFDTEADRAQFVHEMEQRDPAYLSREYRTRFTACKLCGIPASYGTLGIGVAPMYDARDECRGAYANGCKRRRQTRKYLDCTCDHFEDGPDVTCPVHGNAYQDSESHV